jgi:4-O-beta-D-mannosyl-D-glucose phosphorylase
VLFANGWISEEDGKVLIYYASSDTRMHVAVSSVERLVDYCVNTAPDDLRTGKSVEKIINLIDRNGIK